MNPQVVSFTTARLGREVGYSTQQVRDLERLGVLPPAERGANGYRRYTRPHLVALRAYRELAAAIGPVPARRIMPALVQTPLPAAAAAIDDLHGDLASERARLREAIRGLDVVLAESGEVFAEQDAMTSGELARALGVRASALRHWERERLVAPVRTSPTGLRRYGSEAIAQARIVAALRGGGYPVPTIRDVLDQLREVGDTDRVRELLTRRLTDLTRRSLALLAASASLHELLSRRADAEPDAGRSDLVFPDETR